MAHKGSYGIKKNSSASNFGRMTARRASTRKNRSDTIGIQPIAPISPRRKGMLKRFV